jgi:DNA-directed RNA polymerase specialized sigma24 family protein
MLGEWVRDWRARHEHVLAQERTLIPVRAGRRTFLVTAAEAEDALARSHDELYAAFERRSGWGVDDLGRPLSVAVRGLATRRLADRLRDALRARNGRLPDLDIDGQPGIDADPRLLVSPIEAVDGLISLKQSLAAESPTTRAIVLRRALGETAAETASALGLEPAAVRQRIARFTRRNLEVLAA